MRDRRRSCGTGNREGPARSSCALRQARDSLGEQNSKAIRRQIKRLGDEQDRNRQMKFGPGRVR